MNHRNADYPLPLEAGETIAVAGTQARMVAPYPGASRLWFVQTNPDLCLLLNRVGSPIRYGHVVDDLFSYRPHFHCFYFFPRLRYNQVAYRVIICAGHRPP